MLATASRASAAQAQAALESLHTSRSGQARPQDAALEAEAREAGTELLASGSQQHRGDTGHAAHVESFALGAAGRTCVCLCLGCRQRLT